jgi:hypothetical protein
MFVPAGKLQQKPLVDILRFGNAKSDDIERKYTTNHWKELDCVIVVIDKEHFCEFTEDQDVLLNFVRESLEWKVVCLVVLFKTDISSHRQREK